MCGELLGSSEGYQFRGTFLRYLEHRLKQWVCWLERRILPPQRPQVPGRRGDIAPGSERPLAMIKTLPSLGEELEANLKTYVQQRGPGR